MTFRRVAMSLYKPTRRAAMAAAHTEKSGIRTNGPMPLFYMPRFGVRSYVCGGFFGGERRPRRSIRLQRSF